jgi:hypothetical protein
MLNEILLSVFASRWYSAFVTSLCLVKSAFPDSAEDTDRPMELDDSELARCNLGEYSGEPVGV